MEGRRNSAARKFGAGTQIRTADLLITNQPLYLTELFRPDAEAAE